MVVPYEDGAAISDLMRTSAARITRGRLWEKYLPTQTPPLSDLIIRPCDVEIQTAEGAILWEQDLVEDVVCTTYSHLSLPPLLKDPCVHSPGGAGFSSDAWACRDTKVSTRLNMRR